MLLVLSRHFHYPNRFPHHLVRINEDQVYIVQVKDRYFVSFALYTAQHIHLYYPDFSLFVPVPAPFSSDKQRSSVYCTYCLGQIFRLICIVYSTAVVPNLFSVTLIFLKTKFAHTCDPAKNDTAIFQNKVYLINSVRTL